MKYLFLSILSISLSLASCTNAPLETSDPITVFEEFWTFVDENYIYFDLKEVDWDEVYTQYAGLVTEATSDEELFVIMEEALLELKDNHNRLQNSVRLATSYNVKEGYSVYQSIDLIKEKYIVDSLGTSGNLFWAMLDNEVGYVSFPDFARYSAFRSVFVEMKERGAKKFIIDVRGNGGGDSDPLPKLLGILSDEPTSIGSYIEKSGPGHNEVTSPIRVFTTPDPDFKFDLPIVVLIDRGSYSATSYFTAMMKGFDNVTIMGQVTGGGGGGNLGYQLSNGWLVAVSVSDFLDKNGVSIENGVTPDVEVFNTEEDIESGVDKMLEMAIEF